VVRVTAALAVVAKLWGWAAGQYPYMLEEWLTIEQAAAGRAVLQAMLASLGVGALLLVPSLVWLTLFQRGPDEPA
jgi:cytochrome d ubiquinol oxidase subunit II